MVEEQSNEEKIGFHKGSLATLVKERQELQRILSIVEQLMQMHISGLKELGIDLTEQVEKAQEPISKPKTPIEDLI